jgi:hypothetical protein
MLSNYCFLILLMTISWTASAEDFSGKSEMNDIKYSSYKDFATKWELVTIRFRKDTGEMRLTYGNKLAVQTLKKGSTQYPDGAVFAKTGIQTSSDPQFISSVVPKNIRRFQYMVKDKKKYSSTGGWGYALFDNNGKTFPENPKATQDACYACHTIVENRGDVFSEPFDFVKDTKFSKHPEKVSMKINFEWKETKSLPENISSFIPTTIAKVRSVENSKLRKNLFQGTLDEMKPILEEESKTSKTPVLFMSEDNKRFVIVIPKTSEECMEMGSYEIISTDLNNNPIKEKFCTHD